MAEIKSTGVVNEDGARARALARAQLRESRRPHVGYAWGLLSQLRAAGYVPVDLAIDEDKRIGVEWIDEAGRRCRLRPYARHQWEVRREWLPHERDELRLIEQDRYRLLEVEEAHKRTEKARKQSLALQRMRLELMAQAYPESAEAYRESIADDAEMYLSILADKIDGSIYKGCSIDEDSQDEVRAAIASIRATLTAATYRHDTQGKARCRAEVAAFHAKHDEQLQTVLRVAKGTAIRGDFE